MEKINILIRTCGRAELFKRCIDSVIAQNYSNLRVIVSADRPVNYIPGWCEVITPGKYNGPYHYDGYVNDLKAQVNDGWFFVLDDDDTLAPGCLHELQLTSPAILVQLNYMGNIVPAQLTPSIGSVGFPSLVLHYSLAAAYDITPRDEMDHNDFMWISWMYKNVGLTFQPLVLAVVDRKGNGKSGQLGT